MQIESALYNHLANNASIVAKVGTRIYPVKLPQGVELPAITYQRISGVREHNIAGPSGRARPRIQIDCWAESYSEAKSVADTVRLVLDGHKGNFGHGDNTMEDVGGIRFLGDNDIWEEGAEINRVSMDFSIPHFEEI